MRLLLVFSLVLLVTVVANNSNDNDKCTVCRDGQTMSDPSRIVFGEGGGGLLGGQTCLQINNLAQQLFFQSDDNCRLVQSVGTLCGCPPATNSCSVCPNNNSTVLAHPDRELPFLSHILGVWPC